MGYVRNTYGCHCFYGDSSFKRYNRASLGDTFIFNYNSNNTYNCCGGDSRGGFWGGFGMGLGMGFGNMFGGFMGNLFGGFGNMFGGFGMGNMFGGFGFPWGGGFGNWGFGGTPAASTTKTTNTTNASDRNKDTKALADYNKEVDALRKAIVADGKISPENAAKIDDLIARVKKSAENPLDGDSTEKANDTINYNALIDGLNDLKDGKIKAEIDGKPIEIKLGDPMTLDQLEKMSDADFNKITQTEATQILVGMGYIDFDSNSTRPEQTDNTTSTKRLVGKLSNNYRVLQLLQKSGVTVEVENNPTANAKDHWISGPITNVTKGNDGTLSFDVDCTNTGLKGYQAQYTLKATDNTNIIFRATKKSGTVTVDSTRDLKYQDEKKPLLNDGKPVATAGK